MTENQMTAAEAVRQLDELAAQMDELLEQSNSPDVSEAARAEIIATAQQLNETMESLIAFLKGEENDEARR